MERVAILNPTLVVRASKCQEFPCNWGRTGRVKWGLKRVGGRRAKDAKRWEGEEEAEEEEKEKEEK